MSLGLAWAVVMIAWVTLMPVGKATEDSTIALLADPAGDVMGLLKARSDRQLQGKVNRMDLECCG